MNRLAAIARAAVLACVTSSAALGTGCLFSEVVHQEADAGAPDATELDAAIADAPLDAPWPDAAPLTNGVDTIAGSGEPGAADGNRAVARFDNPVNVVRAPDGTLYVADFNNGRIRVIDTEGIVDTLPAPPGFARPFGLALAADGTLYVETDDNELGEHRADTGTIWAVDTANGITTMIAHDLGRPRGLAVLADGRIVMSDPDFHTVSLLDPYTGLVTHLAGKSGFPGYANGNGSAARFNRPYGVAVRSDGKIIVADYGNNVIRLVATWGEVFLYAGAGEEGARDGEGSLAQFAKPQDVALDADDNVYVADSANFLVRKISSANVVTTLAGDGVGGHRDDLDPRHARFFGLEGLDVAPDGTVFLADGNRGEDGPYHRVRRITPTD